MSEIEKTFCSLKEVIEAKNALNSINSQEGRNAVISWMSKNGIEPIGDGTTRFKYSSAKVKTAIENLKKQL